MLEGVVGGRPTSGSQMLHRSWAGAGGWEGDSLAGRVRAGEGAAGRVAGKGKEWLDGMTMRVGAVQGGQPGVGQASVRGCCLSNR